MGYLLNKSEKNACKLLNSKKLTHNWRKDFKIDISTEDWDLTNTERVRIEVKSTVDKNEFKKNRVKFNTPRQHKDIILKLLVDDEDNIIDYKFVRKLKKEWKNINEIVL